MPRKVAPQNASLEACDAPSNARYGKGCRCPGCREQQRLRMAAWYANRGGNPNRKPSARGYEGWSSTRRAAYLRREAAKNAPGSERFKKQEIFDRDNWICWICGRSIDSNLTYPHPFYVSLDHVVPLREGGAHVRSNCRAAHLRCNIQRGRKFLTLETRLDAA